MDTNELSLAELCNTENFEGNNSAHTYKFLWITLQATLITPENR